MLSLRRILSILFLFLAFPAFAQLTAPGSSAVRYTNYPENPDVKDPIFIFCNNVSGTQRGTITATLPDITASNFEWFKWSDATNNFSEYIKTDNLVLSSTANNLDRGGYMVRISGEGIDTNLIGWVFVNRPHSSASLMNRTCDYVALKGGAAVDTFFYRNPENGAAIELPNGVGFLWSSTPQSAIPRPDYNIDPQIFTTPHENVTYKLQVSDSFGCVSESSFFYESIHVKADFSVSPQRGEAPLEVMFINRSSIKATQYEWDFGAGKDSISTLRDPGHVYYRPGEYSVKLTVTSDVGCSNTMTSDKIIVEPSMLDIPNVFTPNGDGINERFVVQKRSLRYLSVEIYSRSGQKVYSFSGQGEALSAWEGWDGTINNSSALASPGVYFYVIRALGWDDVDYDTKAQRGFVYLYR